MLFSKRDDFKAIAKLAIPCGIFNINEPIIFGIPMVMNPVLGIPFFLAPLVCVSLGYFVTSIGLCPLMVIAYAPCINHGIKGKEADGKKRGMNRSQHEEELAVQCGYWQLWRYNPELAKEGKNPFQLDSKAPKWENFRDYLLGEVRFASLKKVRPTW